MVGSQSWSPGFLMSQGTLALEKLCQPLPPSPILGLPRKWQTQCQNVRTPKARGLLSEVLNTPPRIHTPRFAQQTLGRP